MTAFRPKMAPAVAVTALLLTSAFVSPLLADASHGSGHQLFSAGEPGNPKQPFRTVQIDMREGDGTMTYLPKALEVKRGEQIKFVIKNSGALSHEFVLADEKDNLEHAAMMQKMPDMHHEDANGKSVEPGAQSEILWHFSKSGSFEYSCLIPGHREAGMTGKITVK
jgi:uncharacterized cupredoxin-like copper-binding protein